VVSVSGLVKRCSSHEAVAGIDLEVRRGEIFAFLGPNGSGKTTTVEILEGFQPRTAGQVSVLGHDPATADGTWRDRVGVVLQESEPEPGLSVRDCLAMHAGFYRAPRDIDETIALVGLTEQAGALGTRLSGGQRRRLDFALALIGDPELLHLFGYDLRGFLRNRQSRFFTLAQPVLFLVIFASVFGGSGHTTQVAGGRISTSVYYVPGIIALGVIAAMLRQPGGLGDRAARTRRAEAPARNPRPRRRHRRRVLTAIVIAVVMAAVLLGIGWAAYGAHVPGRTALAPAVTVVIGAASFCCLGYALTSLVRTEDAALPTTQALLLPLYFNSGVFVAVTVLPHWLADVGEIFPVRHLANALLVAYNPHTTGLGFAGPDLLIVGAWGAAGLLIAVRTFIWLPRGR
jgi:ABC-2 type transport system permease protein